MSGAAFIRRRKNLVVGMTTGILKFNFGAIRNTSESFEA